MKLFEKTMKARGAFRTSPKEKGTRAHVTLVPFGLLTYSKAGAYGMTFAVKTSSIARPRLQPASESSCRRLSVQTGYDAPP